MLDFLQTLYMLVYWNNIEAFYALLNGGNMGRRCEIDGLFGCEHKKVRLPLTSCSTNSDVVVGDEVANIIQASPIINITRDFPIRRSIDKSPDLAEVMDRSSPKRVLITPPPTEPKPVETKTQVVNVADDFITCHLCQGKVFARYLTTHLRIHVHTFVPREEKKTESTSSTSIVQIPNTTPSTSYTTKSWPNREQYAAFSHTTTHTAPKFKPLERFKFRSLESAYALSSVSKDGRYSDFTIILSQPEQTKTESYSYAGSSSHSYSDWVRFCLHFVYDHQEDYYTISSKLLKRGSYSQWDTEESIVPDRVCFQDEILSEVKKILLFYQFSPKAAYKHFRKLFKQNFVIERDDNQKVIGIQTENIKVLNERLNKKPATTSWSGHGYHEHHSRYDQDYS